MTHTDPHTPETTTPAVIDLTALPGRIIDAVYLASARAGVRVGAFDLELDRDQQPVLTIFLSYGAPRDLAAARAVFAHLGVTAVRVEARPGAVHCTVIGVVPALNTTVRVIADPLPVDPAPGDANDLLAVVDDARAAAGVVLTGTDGSAGVGA